MEISIHIEPTAPVLTENAVSFETGATKAQVKESGAFVYDHHGGDFEASDPGALTIFYEDLLLGRVMPTQFVTRSVNDLDTLVALTLFCFRELVIQERTAGFVASVDLIHRRGQQVSGHFDMDFVRFCRLLRGFFPKGAVPRRVMEERLQTAFGWIREYLVEGAFPSLGPEYPTLKVLDHGTLGFVVGEATGTLLESWVIAYRMGFLRGVIVSPAPGERLRVLASRKSYFCPFDLRMAATLLNEVETAMGQPPEWKHDGNWLLGPPEGTLLPLLQMLEVFLRV